MDQRKVTITFCAAKRRTTRELAKKGIGLRKSRSMQMRIDCGEHYTLDFDRNFIVLHDVDIVELGRAHGVIKPWETVLPE